jgi:hypothetical protein
MNFLSQQSNKNFSVIKSFNDVTFIDNYKPLVICDIDHTFIRCSYGLDHFRKMVSDDANILPGTLTTSLDLDKEAIDFMNSAYNIGFVKQTDPDGFNNMLQNIERLGGKLIFLTARGIISHEKTVNDLKRAGLEHPELFDIHYTNSEMTKGEYLKKTNLTDGYEHISFIDDYPSFIASVHHFFPQINCYLFRYD